ncbi:Uncharacterised protein [Paucimonas lemoignei]|nr:Uncharacterised protein [Paucimonas lemoignei]
MIFIKSLKRWPKALSWIMGSLAAVVIGSLFYASSEDPEIVLTIGDTYQEMRERSSANFSPLISGHVWTGIPKSDARLRFRDPQFGFVTVPARFLVIFFDDNIIESVRISPQVEPLLLDDALRVALDLQDQWRSKGWVLTNPISDPAFEDTPQWRERLRGIQGGRTYWQAADKYQVMMALNRFADDRRPDEERYLFSIGLGPPWTPREDEPFEVEQNCESLAACSTQSTGSQQSE